MSTVSKKEARKASKVVPKGKGKQHQQGGSALKSTQAEVDEDLEGSQDEDVSSDTGDSEQEDEDNGGVSEKGMTRLMELVGPEDLNDEELAIVGGEDEG